MRWHRRGASGRGSCQNTKFVFLLAFYATFTWFLGKMAKIGISSWFFLESPLPCANVCYKGLLGERTAHNTLSRSQIHLAWSRVWNCLARYIQIDILQLHFDFIWDQRLRKKNSYQCIARAFAFITLKREIPPSLRAHRWFLVADFRRLANRVSARFPGDYLIP